MNKKLTLADAQGEWIARHEQRLASNTMANYISLFRKLNTSIGMNPLLSNVTANHIDKLLTNYPHGPTANHQLGKLRTFFTWCVKMGYLTKAPTDPLTTRRVPRTSHQAKHRIPVSDWPTVLRVAGDQHPLHRAVIALGLYLGSRGSELRAIRMSDLQYDRDGNLVRVTVHRTKQDWTTTVPVATELAEEIETWITAYARLIGRIPPPNAYLLPGRASAHQERNSNGQWTVADPTLLPFKQLSASTHLDMINHALKATGYWQEGEGTHTLRRSLAAALYENEIESGYSQALDTVRAMLGHSQTAITEKYIGVDYSTRRLEERLEGKPMFDQPETSDNVIPIHGREQQ